MAGHPTPAVKTSALTSVTRRTASSVFDRDRSINFCKFRTRFRSHHATPLKIPCADAVRSAHGQPIHRVPIEQFVLRPFTTTTEVAAAPNLSGGSSLVVIVSARLTDPRQPASRPGNQPGYPASYPRHRQEEARSSSWFPAAFGTGIRFWVIPSRQGIGPSSRSLPDTISVRDPVGVPRSTLARTTGEVPPIPEDGRCSLTGCRARPAPAASQRPVFPHPAGTSTAQGHYPRGINEVHAIHRPGLPLTLTRCG